jgi:hypothetical protein
MQQTNKAARIFTKPFSIDDKMISCHYLRPKATADHLQQ